LNRSPGAISPYPYFCVHASRGRFNEAESAGVELQPKRFSTISFLFQELIVRL